MPKCNVNGKLAGSTKVGYSAFACEIGTALKLGAENEIIVKADNKARPDVNSGQSKPFSVSTAVFIVPYG